VPLAKAILGLIIPAGEIWFWETWLQPSRPCQQELATPQAGSVRFNPSVTPAGNRLLVRWALSKQKFFLPGQTHRWVARVLSRAVEYTSGQTNW